MQLSKLDKFLLNNIPKYPRDITSRATDKFKLSRMTVNRHLNKLIQLNMIIKSGTTKNSQYYLQESTKKNLHFKVDSFLDEFKIWEKYLEPSFSSLTKNLQDILMYGATELINNIKDHSGAKNMSVTLEQQKNSIIMVIEDDGIGVFRHLEQALHLKDLQESLLNLTKGKVTSDPNNHSGEGIFFTSRAFNEFTLSANGLCYIKNNIEKDWFFKKVSTQKGTVIELILNLDTQNSMRTIFEQYTNPETVQFNKTEVIIKLAQLEDERYVARSQAKRILFNLDKFQKIVLDFKDIEMVGQGFVDEIFRIFQRNHPNITISYINANSNVEFMIKRGLTTARTD